MVDNPVGFWCGGGVKFLPSFSPLALVSLTLVLSSCSTPANRRELYNTSMADSGPWHDYDRRREAEAETGVSAGSAPTVVPGTRGRATAQPKSSDLPAGTAPAPASAGAPPAPAQVTESSTTGAPPVPVNPPSAVAPTVPDAAAPAAATPAPADAAPAPAPVPQ